ncbi:MAG: ABC transporter substrate-binding protein [Coriobacteriales bacterium]
MKLKKLVVVAVACAMAASLALVGCGSSGSSSSDSSSASYSLVNEGQLTVATSPDFPPFENLDTTAGEGADQYVGLDMDIARAVADKLGLEFNPVTIQFDGIIPAIVSGGQADIAISGITISPDREEQVDFSDPYYVDDLSIVVMNSSSSTEDSIDSDLNASDVTIAVQSGTTAESYAKENYPNATASAYGNANDTFAALQAGQVDAVITNKAVGENMLQSYTDCKVVKSIATGEEYGIAVSKDNPQLLEAVNQALSELQQDGTIDELTQKWMS